MMETDLKLCIEKRFVRIMIINDFVSLYKVQVRKSYKICSLIIRVVELSSECILCDTAANIER